MLQLNPLPQSASVVAQVRYASWLDAGEDDFAASVASTGAAMTPYLVATMVIGERNGGGDSCVRLCVVWCQGRPTLAARAARVQSALVHGVVWRPFGRQHLLQCGNRYP